MRFLADQDVYAITVDALRQAGHEVVTAEDLNLSRAQDLELLRRAHREARIMLTRDRDYGRLVFVEGSPITGVLYLRIMPASLKAVHAELFRILELYSERELRRAFVVVEAGRHRLRRRSR